MHGLQKRVGEPGQQLLQGGKEGLHVGQGVVPPVAQKLQQRLEGSEKLAEERQSTTVVARGEVVLNRAEAQELLQELQPTRRQLEAAGPPKFVAGLVELAGYVG